MSKLLLLSVGDEYAKIPDAIQWKVFPDQLSVIREEFWLDVLSYTEENSGTEQFMWVQFRWVTDGLRQWIFVEDIGLLSFEWEYFVEEIWSVGWGFTPKISIDNTDISHIEDWKEETYQGFTNRTSWKYTLYLFDWKNPTLKKFTSDWRDEFESLEVLVQVFIKSGELWEISLNWPTIH